MSFENKSLPLSVASRLAGVVVSFTFLLGLVAGQASATAYGHERDKGWRNGGEHAEWDRSGPRDHRGSQFDLGERFHNYDRPGHPQGPGERITLYDLVIGGESFDSTNGSVSFSNFEIELGDHGDRILEKYSVKPVGNGFELLGPTFSILGWSKELEFSYDVTAAAGLEIVKVGLGVTGFGLFGKSGAKMALSDGDEDLGMLVALSGKRGHHRPHGHHGESNRDRLVLENAVSGLHVDEKLFAKGLLAGNWKTKHSFKTQVIPEPGTALLLGLGLAGLGLSRRRHS